MSDSFTDRLTTATREELLEHVLLQRDLIQRLHVRVLDLEACLENMEQKRDTGAAHSGPVPSPPPQAPSADDAGNGRRPRSTGAPQHVDLAPPSHAESRLDEINRILAAHAAGRPRLPAAMVRQLLLVREDLKDQSTPADKPSAHVTGPRSGRLVQPQWVRNPTSGAAVQSVPSASPRHVQNAHDHVVSPMAMRSTMTEADAELHEQCFDDPPPAFLAQRLLSAWGPPSPPRQAR